MIVLTYANGVPGQMVQVPSGQGRLDVLCTQVKSLSLPQIGLNGSAPATIELVPAGHDRGFWLWSLFVFKRVPASSGLLLATLSYTSPSGPDQAVQPPISLTGVGSAAPTPIAVFSTGDTPLLATLNFLGVTGSPQIDVWSSAQLV